MTGPDKTPSRNDAITIRCPICAAAFAPIGRRRYCSDACKATAHRRRHQPAPAPSRPLPAAAQRRTRTVYECPDCSTRALGDQRCDDCNTFMTRLGYGGLCPGCDEPVTLDELLNN
jgi:hypothetical protein